MEGRSDAEKQRFYADNFVDLMGATLPRRRVDYLDRTVK
jgi:hypothetical protein